jgi:iron complex outermembrane receptor protein
VVLNQAFANDSFSGTPIAVAANFDKTRSVTNTSPRCRWNTRPATRSSLHDRLARLQERRLQHPRQHAGLPALGRPFEDEKLDSLELGAKMVLDGAGWSSTPLFHNKYKNVQLSVFTSYTQANGQPGFFGDFTNAGKATVNGAELEFLWMPSTAWRLSGNLASLDAKYDEYIDRGVNVADQKKFTNTPKFQAALNIEHNRRWPAARCARAWASHRSKVYPTTDLAEALAQDAYTLVNAGLIWEKDSRLSFFLQGSNLTNKAYKTDGYNIAAWACWTPLRPAAHLHHRRDVQVLRDGRLRGWAWRAALSLQPLQSGLRAVHCAGHAPVQKPDTTALDIPRTSTACCAWPRSRCSTCWRARPKG